MEDYSSYYTPSFIEIKCSNLFFERDLVFYLQESSTWRGISTLCHEEVLSIYVFNGLSEKREGYTTSREQCVTLSLEQI